MAAYLPSELDILLENLTLSEIHLRIQACQLLSQECPDDADYFRDRIKLLEMARDVKEWCDMNNIPTIIKPELQKALARQINQLEGRVSYLYKMIAGQRPAKAKGRKIIPL